MAPYKRLSHFLGNLSVLVRQLNSLDPQLTSSLTIGGSKNSVPYYFLAVADRGNWGISLIFTVAPVSYPVSSQKIREGKNLVRWGHILSFTKMAPSIQDSKCKKRQEGQGRSL